MITDAEKAARKLEMTPEKDRAPNPLRYWSEPLSGQMYAVGVDLADDAPGMVNNYHDMLFTKNTHILGRPPLPIPHRARNWGEQ